MSGSYALGGWTVGLQRVADGSTRVWVFRMLLGAFVPGTRHDDPARAASTPPPMMWR